jgi:hypothetical protein
MWTTISAGIASDHAPHAASNRRVDGIVCVGGRGPEVRTNQAAGELMIKRAKRTDR